MKVVQGHDYLVIDTPARPASRDLWGWLDYKSLGKEILGVLNG